MNVWQRLHWARRRKLGHEIHWAVMAALRQAPAAPLPADGPVRLRVEVVRQAPRLLDVDNFIGGAKCLLDALVQEGVLHDDSSRWCEPVYEQKQGAPQMWVTVTVA